MAAILGFWEAKAIAAFERTIAGEPMGFERHAAALISRDP
jgi:hypothetical protein